MVQLPKPQRKSNFVCVCVWWAVCGILVPQPEIEPGATAVKVPSSNNPWTTREFPQLSALQLSATPSFLSPDLRFIHQGADANGGPLHQSQTVLVTMVTNNHFRLSTT